MGSAATEEPLLYLPFRDRYALPGGLYPLGAPGAGARHLEVDRDRPRYLEEKRRALAAGRVPGWVGPAPEADAAVAGHLGAVRRRESPDAGGDAVTGLGPLLEGLQEDAVVLRRPPQAAASQATADHVHVCFASGWCPRCAHGADFMAIHAPVPGGKRFETSQRVAFAAQLFDVARGPRVRFVWTVTSGEQLDRRHCAHGHGSATVTPWPRARSIFLRVERQVIAPIDATLSLFLIRVYVYPMARLPAQRRRDLREAIAHMDEPVARYKGLWTHRPRILRLLDHA